MRIVSNCIAIIGIMLLASIPGFSQPTRPAHAGEILHSLRKLTVLGSALYIAAHPDDENTTVLAYLANGRRVRTAYLSLTRGGGGQNLIGNEKGELLGVIRTQELLAARRIDGPEQYFTRAIDFGYSKNPEETLGIWDREKILADVVWAIRRFRPDVILTRFTPEFGGHGQHRASAILAEEAFHAAADPGRFPEQLRYVQPWQAKRLLWDAWRSAAESGEIAPARLLSLEVGGYNSLLGFSYPELAARSRSQHKCQGFGVLANRGEQKAFFQFTAGDPPGEDLFDGIELSWERIPGAAAVGKLLAQACDQFDMERPAASLPLLLQIDRALEALPDDPWVMFKRQELQQVIRNCAGLWLEAIAVDFTAIPGRAIPLEVMLLNRSGYPLTLESIAFPFAAQDSTVNQALPAGKAVSIRSAPRIAADQPYTEPYWLRRASETGTYIVEDQTLIGLPEAPPALSAVFNVNIDGRRFRWEVPLYYRWRDPVAGESYRPVEISPAVTVNFEAPLYLFADDQPREVRLTLQAGARDLAGKLRLKLPEGWQASLNEIPFQFTEKGQTLLKRIKITAPGEAAIRELSAEVEIGGQVLPAHSLTRIEYDHIPIQTLFPEARARLVRLDLKSPGGKIGYVMGSGDEIPALLDQIGFRVELLSDEDLDSRDLSQYRAIITGIRAYNTRDHLKVANPRLFRYVENGGTLITQYNTYGLVTEQLGPYPLKLSRDRVTVESAPVSFLDPAHPLLNRPNRITAADMGGWVQERGLYFPNEWDPAYRPLFAMNDPGEDPKKGSLIYARYGKGVHIYSGIAWFRQLPAGVPGAFRLFINLIAAGEQN